MKQVNFIWLCLTCLVFLQPVYAQDDTQSYSKFRALLQTGERIEIENGILTDSVLTNFVSENEPIEIPISDIRALDRRAGNKALLYGGIGLGIGLLSSLLAVAQIEVDPNTKLKEDAGLIIAGITAGAGLIGVIAGLMTDDWEKVPLNASLNAYFNKGDYQLTLKISF